MAQQKRLSEQQAKELLDSWFNDGSESALREVYGFLQHILAPSPEVVRVVGREAADELRQDVVFKLLNHPSGSLRGVDRPLAYARVVWRHAAISALRIWGLRAARAPEVYENELQRLASTPSQWAEMKLDSERMWQTVTRLPLHSRLAVLLTTLPARITAEDWMELVSKHPPPPPVRPMEPLERDKASLLLYPGATPEQPDDTLRRRSNFDRTYSRAVAVLRKCLLEDP